MILHFGNTNTQNNLTQNISTVDILTSLGHLEKERVNDAKLQKLVGLVDEDLGVTKVVSSPVNEGLNHNTKHKIVILYLLFHIKSGKRLRQLQNKNRKRFNAILC